MEVRTVMEAIRETMDAVASDQLPRRGKERREGKRRESASWKCLRGSSEN